MPAAAKRRRGRPRLTPSPTAHERAIRVRKDGAAFKAPTRIAVDQLASWLEANHTRYWSGRGRPPQGCVPLVQAAAAHFGVSRRTVARLAAVIAERQARAARARPLDAAAAGLLAALSERYQRIPALAPAALRAPGAGRARMPGTAAPQSSMARHGNSAAAASELADGILRYLGEHADAAFLERVVEVGARRRRALDHPPAAAGDAHRGARGLDAIGLQAVMLPAHGVTGTGAAAAHAALIREALLEALEAYAALGDDGAARGAADALARMLAAPAARPHH